MASERYPVLEVLDGLRQLLYVPAPFQDGNGAIVDVWGQLARDNPLWQLDKRRQFTLNRPLLLNGRVQPVIPNDSDGPIRRIPYAPQPYNPATSFDDQFLLPRPQLFDNLREIGIQASSLNEGLTGVCVEWINFSDLSFDEEAQSLYVFRAYLVVINQNNPYQRALRYMNWFNNVLRTTKIDRTGVQSVLLVPPPLAIRNIIQDMNRSSLRKPVFTTNESDRIEQLDGLSATMIVNMDYLDEQGSTVSSSDDTLFLRR